ncbi:MAG: hypothetical protein HN514_01330 [Candidatus Marinimicrobia bacterium]|jgi:hypothetical protein|nr:hypothetical protein [Candidatus Neomarinimicrobiota bacterium]MBT7901662.1 hypothetical protein [Candidatus Neomarinimicrobiota bacterium]
MLEKISNINEEIKSEVKKYNNSWIGLGMKLIELSEEIQKNDKISWKSEFGVSNFSEYCAVILKEDYDKMIKIRSAGTCIKKNRIELYEEYKKDNSIIFPGFSLIYLVESNKSMLEEIGKYDELIDNLFEDRLKRFDLDEKIRGYKKRKVNVGKNGKSKIESDTFSYDFDLIERRENLFLTVIPNLKKEINDVFEDDDERVIEIKDDLDKLEEKIRDLVLENDGVETNE